MKILIIGLLTFGVWTTATTYWYICKIENMCLDERSNKDLAVNIPTEKIEEAKPEKAQKSILFWFLLNLFRCIF